MSPNEILCQVARETSVTVRQMRSGRRWAALTRARKLAAQRLFATCPDLTYSDIGRLLGKHPTSVRFWLGLTSAAQLPGQVTSSSP